MLVGTIPNGKGGGFYVPMNESGFVEIAECLETESLGTS